MMGRLLCAFSLLRIDDGPILGASSKFRDRTYFQNTSQMRFFENEGSCGAFWMNPLMESAVDMVLKPHTNFGRQCRGSYGAFWIHPLMESAVDMVLKPHTNFGRQWRGSYVRPSHC